MTTPGTTSACAENTLACRSASTSVRNYLRVRGEYTSFNMVQALVLELPPRARRIPTRRRISAGHSGNYLRVRGEYDCYRHDGRPLRELPPRARRIRPRRSPRPRPAGTTSACAENTASPLSFSCLIWNYLRVRGEYQKSRMIFCKILELPPRARRIRFFSQYVMLPKGTTSACAENTTNPPQHNPHPWNYLRVRGEYPK